MLWFERTVFGHGTLALGLGFYCIGLGFTIDSQEIIHRYSGNLLELSQVQGQTNECQNPFD